MAADCGKINTWGIASWKIRVVSVRFVIMTPLFGNAFGLVKV